MPHSLGGFREAGETGLLPVALRARTDEREMLEIVLGETFCRRLANGPVIRVNCREWSFHVRLRRNTCEYGRNALAYLHRNRIGGVLRTVAGDDSVGTAEPAHDVLVEEMPAMDEYIPATFRRRIPQNTGNDVTRGFHADVLRDEDIDAPFSVHAAHYTKFYSDFVQILFVFREFVSAIIWLT